MAQSRRRPFPPLPPRPARRGGDRRGHGKREERGLAAGREPDAHGARRARLAGGVRMTDTRTRRLHALAELDPWAGARSQEEVDRAARRRSASPVTQATVSRDLDQFGAVKVKRGGVAVLRAARPDRRRRLGQGAARADPARNGSLSIEAAGPAARASKTPPGSAHLVASRDRPCADCPKSPAPSRATTRFVASRRCRRRRRERLQRRYAYSGIPRKRASRRPAQ